jgi:hypothetical protein
VPERQRSAGAAIARVFLWPLKRFFDPRFEGIATQISVTHDHVVGEFGATNSRLDETSRNVAGIGHEVAEIRKLVEQIREPRRDPQGRRTGEPE